MTSMVLLVATIIFLILSITYGVDLVNAIAVGQPWRRPLVAVIAAASLSAAFAAVRYLT